MWGTLLGVLVYWGSNGCHIKITEMETPIIGLQGDSGRPRDYRDVFGKIPYLILAIFVV